MASATLTVQHGRRKGTTKDFYQDELPQAEAIHPREIALVTGNEWQRIKNSLTKKQDEEEKLRVERDKRLRLHRTSKDIVKNWENTIEGQRQKKLQAKRIREEKEEEEKKKVDIEEAKFQAQKRKEAIDHAKKLQYYQTDRVKGFHGALLLTEVLRERDAQVEYKKRKQEAAKGRDGVYAQRAREAYERGMLDDQEQAVARLTAKKVVAEFQIEQVREHVQKAEKLKSEDQAEGATIRREVEEFHKKRLEEEEKRQEEKIKLNQTLHDALDHKRQIQAMRQKDEEGQEEEIRLFVEAKKKMMRMRKEQERALFKQLRDQQDKMVSQLASQMQTKVDDEDKKIAQAVEETDKKREDALRAKELQRQERKRAIHEHRTEMMAENEMKRKEEEERDIEMLKQRVELDMKFHQGALNDEKKRREVAKQLQSFHDEQIEQRCSAEDKLHSEQLEFDKKQAEALKAEEEQFQRYAETVLKEAEETNSCMPPLRAAVRAGAGGGRGPSFDGLGGLRPSFQAMDSTGVQLPSYCRQRKRVQGRPSKQPGSTQKRMGFTW